MQVAALRKQVGASRHEVRRTGSSTGWAQWASPVPDGAEVGVRPDPVVLPGGIMATGTVTAPWRASAGAAAGRSRARWWPPCASVCSVGASEQDEDAYPLTGDELDLEPWPATR